MDRLPTLTFDMRFPAKVLNLTPLPLFAGKVAADDYVEKNLDLNELLVQKPAATFFARAQGNSIDQCVLQKSFNHRGNSHQWAVK